MKDLEIKIDQSGIDCFTNLVIERDGKHYQIPMRTRDSWNPLDISPNRIKENIEHFMNLCHNYTKNYKLMTEKELGSGPIKLSQEEIEL